MKSNPKDDVTLGFGLLLAPVAVVALFSFRVLWSLVLMADSFVESIPNTSK